jgi:hypothetical protein
MFFFECAILRHDSESTTTTCCTGSGGGPRWCWVVGAVTLTTICSNLCQSWGRVSDHWYLLFYSVYVFIVCSFRNEKLWRFLRASHVCATSTSGIGVDVSWEEFRPVVLEICLLLGAQGRGVLAEVAHLFFVVRTIFFPLVLLIIRNQQLQWSILRL